MKLTVQQVIDLNNIFINLSNQVVEFKTARKFALIIEQLTRQVTLLKGMLKSTYQDDYNKYNQEVETLRYAYAQKDGLGNLVLTETNDYIIRENDRTEYELKFQALSCKYEKSINKYAEICNTYLKEIIDVDLPTLTEEDICNLQLTPQNYKILSLIIGE